MILRRATPEDGGKLKEFFESTTLPGSIDFEIQRPAGFFDHYRLLSDEFETLVLEEDDGSIAGLASLIFRRGVVLGEETKWAYATDLRIAPTRRAISQWAQHYVPVLERALNEHDCRYVFSVVEKHDQEAHNALIRPTSHARRNLPRYLLANRFRIVNLHGRIPLSERPLEAIKLKPLAASDIEELVAYLRTQSAAQPLSSLHSAEKFFSELARWPGLSLADFRVARDSKGRIRGTAALYDAKQTQRFVPLAYHGFAQTAHQLFQLARLAGFVRPTPVIGREFKVRFLSHLACDNGEVFHALVDEAFSRLSKRELLSYLHFKGNWRTLPPRSFIASSIPFGFYQVLPPGMEAKPWPKPGLEVLPPEFEAAWL